MSGNEDIFKALADGHRRRILQALCGGPMVAGELGRLVGLAPNAVSFHLKSLRSSGLVWVRREGRCLRYHANTGALAEWQADVDRLFPTAAASAAAAPLPTPTRSVREPASRPPEYSRPAADAAPPDGFDDTLPTELL